MVVNDWTLYLYPLFDDQLAAIQDRVEKARKARPAEYRSESAAKLLTKIRRQTQELIPENPAAPAFRQGNTLGKQNRQWFRAKFHLRYRLFFRFSTANKAIVYAWMNHELTLRKSGSKTDPYAIFEAMLEAGDPPKSFEELVGRSRAL